MTHWIAIAAVSMAVASMAHQLGFVEKAYAVCGDIAKCPMCTTFWVTLPLLVTLGCRPLEAVVLSFAAAYLSNWFGLLLWTLSKIYDDLWQRQRRNPLPKKSRKPEA